MGGWAPEPVWMQGLEEKSYAPVGDRTPIVQPVVSHYTDWATAAHFRKRKRQNIQYVRLLKLICWCLRQEWPETSVNVIIDDHAVQKSGFLPRKPGFCPAVINVGGEVILRQVVLRALLFFPACDHSNNGRYSFVTVPLLCDMSNHPERFNLDPKLGLQLWTRIW
jgi:hypothetical protein